MTLCSSYSIILRTGAQAEISGQESFREMRALR